MQRTSQAKMVLDECYTLCERAFGKIVVVFADPPLQNALVGLSMVLCVLLDGLIAGNAAVFTDPGSTLVS
jgi:hypothetical protein